MAIKKSQIYKSLWTACDELRGGIEPASYKDYVLVFLFLKYISDKYTNQKYAPIKVPKGSTFNDLVKLKGKTDIGNKINKKILQPISSENNLNTFPDFNDPQKLGSGKEMIDRLSNLISVFESKDLDFSNNRADGDDILGDAYEYLMRNFASESGKKKGAFYTPSEVSRIISLMIGISKNKTSAKTTVFDPTCGSGSLLLKVSDAAKSNISLYGQELDISTAVLAQMNMILHNNPTAQIIQGNTLADPKFLDKGKLKKFDFIVANPPFSDKRWSNGINIDEDIYNRFEFGVPPGKQGDYAYLLHVLSCLKEGGKAGIILPHGILFRGNAEETIRKNILKTGYIKCIAGLPSNLFYGTGIPACIVLLHKDKNESQNKIFMINASKNFIKDGPKNKLREMDIKLIIDAYENKEEIKNFSKYVTYDEIIKEDYTLNLPRYISVKKDEELENLDAHLEGGIPTSELDKLSIYWKFLPNLKELLIKDKNEKYKLLKFDNDSILTEVKKHKDYSKLIDDTKISIQDWLKQNYDTLFNLTVNLKPKTEFEQLTKTIFESFDKNSIVVNYEIYEEFTTYWDETLSDDLYMVSAEGWNININTVEKKSYFDWSSDLLPKDVVISNFFVTEKNNLDQLNLSQKKIENELDEIIQENSDENGIFLDFDKINKTTVSKKINEIKEDKNQEDLLILRKCLLKYEELSKIKSKFKIDSSELNKKSFKHVSQFNENEIKNIIIEKKWFLEIEKKIIKNLNKKILAFVSEIKNLSERYSISLSELENNIDIISKEVENNLNSLKSWKK
jgi:type I restriction enzyme M protein